MTEGKHLILRVGIGIMHQEQLHQLGCVLRPEKKKTWLDRSEEFISYLVNYEEFISYLVHYGLWYILVFIGVLNQLCHNYGRAKKKQPTAKHSNFAPLFSPFFVAQVLPKFCPSSSVWLNHILVDGGVQRGHAFRILLVHFGTRLTDLSTVFLGPRRELCLWLVDVYIYISYIHHMR